MELKAMQETVRKENKTRFVLCDKCGCILHDAAPATTLSVSVVDYIDMTSYSDGDSYEDHEHNHYCMKCFRQLIGEDIPNKLQLKGDNVELEVARGTCYKTSVDDCNKEFPLDENGVRTHWEVLRNRALAKERKKKKEQELENMLKDTADAESERVYLLANRESRSYEDSPLHQFLLNTNTPLDSLKADLDNMCKTVEFKPSTNPNEVFSSYISADAIDMLRNSICPKCGRYVIYDNGVKCPFFTSCCVDLIKALKSAATYDTEKMTLSIKAVVDSDNITAFIPVQLKL